MNSFYLWRQYIDIHEYHANEISYQIKYRYLLTPLNRYRSILFVFTFILKKHIYIYLVVRMLLWKVDGTWRQNMYLIQLWTLPKTYFSTLNYYISFRMHNVLSRDSSHISWSKINHPFCCRASMASNSLICRWGIHSN